MGLRFYQQRSIAPKPPQTTLTPSQTEGQTSVVDNSKKEEEEALMAVQDRININAAVESELVLLDGIGEVLAKRIIQKREDLGGFQSVEQLLEVEGIGENLFDRIKDYVKVE